VLEQMPGKAVEKIVRGKVDGPHGKQPVVWVCFTDGTRHGFVIPKE
jgi:hypothetical protein